VLNLKVDSPLLKRERARGRVHLIKAMFGGGPCRDVAPVKRGLRHATSLQTVRIRGRV